MKPVISQYTHRLPVIALVGRTNVGKSTLFNRLTCSRKALVADEPALTRDRLYGYIFHAEFSAILIDTGGMGCEETEMDRLITSQCEKAIDEADIIGFVVDAKAGLSPADEMLAKRFRRLAKPVVLIVNKVEHLDESVALAEFYSLGFKPIVPVSAEHGQGIERLMQAWFVLTGEVVPVGDAEEAVASNQQAERSIRLAVIGKPNVGKSTLINYLLDEERVIVSDQSGTTRDSVEIPFKQRGQYYTLIDTAGIRRRRSVHGKIEKFSVIQSLKAIEQSHVVIFMVDASENVTEQDLHLLGCILESGRPMVLLVNKWDSIDSAQREWVKKELDRRLSFLEFVETRFVSLKQGRGLRDLFKLIRQAYRSSTRVMKTSQINLVLRRLVEKHEPPMVQGRRSKLRFAHMGGENPPTIVIHGTQLRVLPNSYIRYLENGFRRAFKLVGTPVRIEVRETDNPYV
jgi:GTP-binding protein